MNVSSPESCRPFLRLSGARLRKVQLSLFLTGFLLLLTQIASAATYTVTNTADSGPGSLRDAITQVNAGAGGDTINFSGVSGTITVGSQMVISKTVTINGPGANILAISGGDTTRIFNLGGGTTIISGLTITHGNATVIGMSQGAAINSGIGTLTVNNCVFSYNTSGGVGALNVGGAILGGTGTITVNNSTFFSNKALTGNGGAIARDSCRRPDCAILD